MDRDTATLTDIQDRLHAHFRSLAIARERIGLPIFALEHGLNPAELERVNALLRARHKARLPLAPHWLLWAVYASEAGYGYAGDEYWRSFEKQTPNWQFHDRAKIKTWFGKFQKSFNGVVPSGPWAEQFSIIAWPITHALLPRYLQLQFAGLLYDLRFRLALASLDAGSIGRLLAGHASPCVDALPRVPSARTVDRSDRGGTSTWRVRRRRRIHPRPDPDSHRPGPPTRTQVPRVAQRDQTRRLGSFQGHRPGHI